MSQCYITNLGAGLVQRSVAEEKPIVFSRVCFNTEYVGKASALFFKPVEWYGENLGVVVGSQSHVSVSGVSCLCNTQLAIQCNDNSQAWKTVSIFAHLEGEDNEILFAAQSLMNGTVKNVFLMEIPVCLDGAVEDFGEVMDADAAEAIGDVSGDLSGYGASIAYDGENTLIQLKNASGTVISSLDASDFVIDGMVEDVAIIDGNLVISFNTASGKQDIEIPLSDIFDPSLYYTKTETDTAISTAITALSLGAASQKGVDSSIGVDSDANLPTSGAVKSYVESKGYAEASNVYSKSDVYTKEEIDGGYIASVSFNASNNTLTFSSGDGTTISSIDLDSQE